MYLSGFDDSSWPRARQKHPNIKERIWHLGSTRQLFCRHHLYKQRGKYATFFDPLSLNEVGESKWPFCNQISNVFCAIWTYKIEKLLQYYHPQLCMVKLGLEQQSALCLFKILKQKRNQTTQQTSQIL